jgi:hypothetical protein
MVRYEVSLFQDWQRFIYQLGLGNIHCKAAHQDMIIIQGEPAGKTSNVILVTMLQLHMNDGRIKSFQNFSIGTITP